MTAVRQQHDAADPAAVIAFLRDLLGRVLPPTAVQWFDGEIESAQAKFDERRLNIAVGMVGRKVGRRDLAPSADDIAAAEKLRPLWQPQHWATDEAARVAIVLATYRGEGKDFAARVDRLCATGELNEHVAYLKGFAIFPAGKDLHGRARKGVRSSTTAVFQAIACNNPYPHDYFDDDAWNQMVVKCVFSGLPIESIVGLHARRNRELVVMLRDLVSERQAAGRVTPEEVHRYVEVN
jgi:hypothetical protein